MGDSGLIRFGSFELNPASGELRKNGARVKLQEQPFQVLRALVQRPGEVVTREELQEHLWPGDTFVEFDDGLNTAVRKIRQALGDAADNPHFVETLPRRGYRFIAPVQTEQLGRVKHPETTSQAAATGTSKPGATWRGLTRVGAMAIVIVIVGAAVWRLGDFESPSDPKTADREISVAVLPLDDLSPGDDQAYFSDGMTDALISDLGGISALRVISRTSVMKYRDARRSAPEVARELGVTHVVDGSVLRAGGKVRITVQLIDAPEDRQLWSRSYERELSDVLNLQREVARAVADGIRVKLTGAEEAQLTRTGTVSAAAFEAYLRGREAPHIERVKYFEAAIKEEPEFALAHAWLGHAYASLALGFTEKSPEELIPKAKASVERALELDGALPDAHRCVGDIKLNYDWDWEGAEAAYREAIRLNPSSAMARISYAFLFAITGRREEGFREIREAQRLAPHWLRVKFFVAYHHELAGNHDQAIGRYGAILQQAPDLWLARAALGENYALKGMHAEALDHLDKVKGRSGLNLRPLAATGWVHGLTGDRNSATAAARELEQLSLKRYVPPYIIAWVYAGMNDNGKALNWLEAGESVRDLLMVNLKVDPKFERLRSQPRFQALLEKMDLARAF